jgi:hypothetical protein
MTSAGRSWTQDLCHSAGSICDAEGRLTRLGLAGEDLGCPHFPTQLGELSELRVLNLGGNLLQASTPGSLTQPGPSRVQAPGSLTSQAPGSRPQGL